MSFSKTFAYQEFRSFRTKCHMWDKTSITDVITVRVVSYATIYPFYHMIFTQRATQKKRTQTKNVGDIFEMKIFGLLTQLHYIRLWGYFPRWFANKTLMTHAVFRSFDCALIITPTKIDAGHFYFKVLHPGITIRNFSIQLSLLSIYFCGRR